MSAQPSVTPRAQPFYCPYCGEEDVRPDHEEGAFHCAVCDRRFTLSFLGVGGATFGTGG